MSSGGNNLRSWLGSGAKKEAHSPARKNASAGSTPSKKRKEEERAVDTSSDSDVQTQTSKRTRATPTRRSAQRSKPNYVVDDDDDDDDIEFKAEVKPDTKSPAPPKRKEAEVIDLDEFGDDFDIDVDLLDAQKYSQEPVVAAAKTKTPPAKKLKVETKEAAAVAKEKSGSSATAQSSQAEAPAEGGDFFGGEAEAKPKFNYMQYKQGLSDGPKNPGSKPLPDGEQNCLLGLTLVFTGQLDSTDRDTAQALAKRYGAKVTGQPSSRTSYVVLGDDAGPKKLELIKKHSCKTLSEDTFFDLIRSLPPKSDDGKELPRSKVSKPPASVPEPARPTRETTPRKAAAAVEVAPSIAPAAARAAVEEEASIGLTGKDFAATFKLVEAEVKAGRRVRQPSATKHSGKTSKDGASVLWTDKYAPQELKDLVGNKPSIERMNHWLRTWGMNVQKNFPGASNHRACLLSGPPGIGKTSAARLVAQANGYEVLEFNASDTRSKLQIDAKIKELTQNHSMIEYLKESKAPARKQLIVMDEVDGMSAGDRGGNQQLIQLIKKTRVPIVAICNDRQKNSVRSLANYCHDLKFSRPRATEMSGRLTDIARREGLEIAPNVIAELATGTQSDLRQILNLLSTYKLAADKMDFDSSRHLVKVSQKNTIMGNFEIARCFLNAGTFTSMSLGEKVDAYFMDFSIAPLMVQENYLKMMPSLPPAKSANGMHAQRMAAFSTAADAISESDLVDRRIFSAQDWSLMPVHAIFSCVRPAAAVLGSLNGQIEFPKQLGNISKTNKYWRMLRELTLHMSLRISGDKNEVRQNYLPAMIPRLTRPLAESPPDIEGVIELMDTYYLNKEDLDAVLEFGVGYLHVDEVQKGIASTTKAALTRMYNKLEHKTPFAYTSKPSATGASEAKAKPDVEEAVDDDDADVVVAEENSNDGDAGSENGGAEDLSKLKMVKAKKPTAAKAKGKGKAKK